MNARDPFDLDAVVYEDAGSGAKTSEPRAPSERLPWTPQSETPIMRLGGVEMGEGLITHTTDMVKPVERAIVPHTQDLGVGWIADFGKGGKKTPAGGSGGSQSGAGETEDSTDIRTIAGALGDLYSTMNAAAAPSYGNMAGPRVLVAPSGGGGDSGGGGGGVMLLIVVMAIAGIGYWFWRKRKGA